MQFAGPRGILRSPDPVSERGNGTETIDIITVAAGMTDMGVTTTAATGQAGTSGMTTATGALVTATAAEMGVMRKGVAETATGGMTGGCENGIVIDLHRV